MSEARLTKVRTALSRQLAMPGGRSVAEAERRAEGALQAHREGAFAELARLVGELEAVCAERGEGDTGRVYALASSLVDLSGFFDTGAFYEAAYSLCDLTDRARAADAWSWEAVAVHVQALRLLQGAGLGGGSPHAAELLAGLRRVVASVVPASVRGRA